MKNRVFTPEFKLGIVKASLCGEKSIVQLCREHNLSDSLVCTTFQHFYSFCSLTSNEVESNICSLLR